MLTFLELYQTLLGFVFFKLYTDAGLVYPPALDVKKDENAAGVGSYLLQEVSEQQEEKPKAPKVKVVEIEGRQVSGKDVYKTIKSLTTSSSSDQNGMDVDVVAIENDSGEVEEDFVMQPSKSDVEAAASLPTLQSLEALPQSINTSLFAPYTFWLSRETSRPIFEFLVRSFGGRIGWPSSSGGGSPFEESDDSITHVIIDRPVVEPTQETDEQRERKLKRKYIQPQWIVDSINAAKPLLEAPYAQGQSLPPHLSPFGEYEGAYDPTATANEEGAVEEESEEEDVEIEDAQVEDAEALKAVATAATEDAAALRAAELAAEAAGIDPSTFEKEVSKSRRQSKKKGSSNGVDEAETDMNKMLMSNKQKKLYEKMKYSQNKRSTEVCKREFLLMEVLISCFSVQNWRRRRRVFKGKTARHRRRSLV